MKFSTLASLGGFAALASANAAPDYHGTAMCTDKTVTQTVTVTAGAGPSPPLPTTSGYSNRMMTSVEYSTQTTSTNCPAAGTYAHPQIKGSSISCGRPGWTTYTVPYTTVYAYPSASGDSKKDCTVAVYQEVTVINVVIVDISITIVDGKAQTVTVTKDNKPTYTPPPVASTTSGAPYSQKTIHVDVGGDNLIFNPNQVRANVGDIVEFNFLKLNHTLTQSEFLTPCTFNGGFDTGFNQFNNGTVIPKPVQFPVTTEKPQWFYCKQPVGNHCGKGMVFGINPDNMDQFIKNAIAQNGNPTATPTASSTGSATGTASAIPTVTVGGGKNLIFNPPFLQNIKRGDKIFFDFLGQNHTLTESSFEKPCTKLYDTQIDTNFQNFNPGDVPGAKPFILTVDSDGERYFYCRQGNHCSMGMVFAINIDKAKFDKFQLAATQTRPKIKGRMPL